MNEHEELLKALRQQEEELQFASFTNDTALAVGTALLQEASKHRTQARRLKRSI